MQPTTPPGNTAGGLKNNTMKTNTNYMRVIPRDLFNEAKLLKCIGQLVLKIHDRQTPCLMGVIETGEPFKIGLNDEGSLRITNLDILINKKKYIFKTTYNSKSNYPLFVEHDYCDHKVFNESGDFDQEFIEFVKTL